ncbi:response regulator [Mucilaginibacter sp. BJC16-A38]|uniref:response regulator n=1 Tax=Mucilaginibacter phenanthrenivorans TaxID=1234842 RepID=UPI00215718EB|nr:response regulator [Mucilaginibacter phenanthrenivorans]MCR8557838.1 response regulator [Mucilaginibacter phenanthrenivorans]
MLIPEKPLIAIVDDDQVYRVLLRFLLTKNNYNLAFEAKNGADCICQLQESLLFPNLIIVDLEMPIMDGFRTVKLIKLHWPEIKIIAHSSILDPTARQRVIACGANDFIAKGNQTIKICELVQKVLNNA